METNSAQKESIGKLMEAGWPEAMARAAVVLRDAGDTNAESELADIVKAMSKDGSAVNKVKVEAEKKRLREELKAVAGKSDFPSIQKSISLKRQLSKLDR